MAALALLARDITGGYRNTNGVRLTHWISITCTAEHSMLLIAVAFYKVSLIPEEWN
jgi:hypothetical protein